MSKEKKPFYLTTTLPYVNSNLHMGHALEFVRADIIARFKKIQGYDVFFNTGTDEHGMKIYEKARSFGKSSQEFVDESFLNFKESVKIFGMDEEILHFVRTTDEHHLKAAKEFWLRVYNNGFIYKKNYEAKYCVGCEETKSDSDLVNGECPIHPGRPIETIEEENYFFRYSAFGEKLLNFYEEKSNFIIPDFRYNEIKAFVTRGLQDFSISRLKSKMPWGIEVPNDSEHVMYVWFDALVNYISTLGWPENVEQFEKYWVNGNPTQYCGKDNTRFQSAMWQAMLMAAEIPNSHQIVVNGFITGDGGIKMSKTLGNVVDPKDIVSEYGTDALRFFLAKEISNFEDSPFTAERFKEDYNSGLANGLGNLVSRVMTMAENNLEAPVVIPEASIPTEYTDFLNAFEINKAVDLIWHEISALDLIIQTKVPFKLVKTDIKAGREIISSLVVSLNMLARMLSPVLPETSEKILSLIKENKKPTQPLFLRKE
ncbi:MAG: methionine--tRNA ligase [Candidatus Paceibacterota bacterium]|jgi:methionyl-tRNA synthetase